MLAGSATELCTASSSWMLTPGTRCLLLLPLLLTHFMTSRLRVTRLNTPLGRYDHVWGEGAHWEGWAFALQHSPCLVEDSWLCRGSV